LKIGDKVRINKEKTIKQFQSNGEQLPEWYTNEIFTITHINNSIITLDKNLQMYGNLIHENYLISLKEERKNKLLKIDSL